MRRALLVAAGFCEVASSSSEKSMEADSATFDEGFRARLAGVGWGLVTALFFVLGAIVDR